MRLDRQIVVALVPCLSLACDDDSGGTNPERDAAATSDDDGSAASSDDDSALDDDGDDDAPSGDNDDDSDDSSLDDDSDDDESDDDDSDDDESDDDRNDDDSDDDSDDDGDDDTVTADDDVAAPGPDAGADSELDGGVVSPPGEIPDDYLGVFESGSRLKARTYVVAGAPNGFVGFYDSALGANCTFTDAQGELRCLPEPPDVISWRGFANPDCTGSVVVVPDCAPAEVFTREPTGQCRNDLQVRRHGELNQSVVLHDFDENEDCVEVSASVDFAGAGRIDLGVVEFDAFVGGERRLLATAGQLTIAVVDAEDGAVGPLWLADVALDARCDAAYGPDPTPCYPTRRAWADPIFYWDAQCTEPASVAYEATPRACDEVDYLINLAAAEGEPGLYQVGAEVTEEVWTSAAGCMSRNDSPWMEHLLELGAPVTTSPAKIVGIRLGDGRLQGVAAGEGDSPMLLSRDQFWDTELQAYCQPQRVNDQLRCLPGILSSWANAWGQYSDPACTDLLVYCNTGSCEDMLFLETGEVEDSCGASNATSLKRLAERVVNEVYELQGADCVGPVDPFEAWTWQDVDPAEFAPLDLVMEP